MRASVLVVDDEPRILDIIRLTLEREGFDVFEALDGYTALERARQIIPDIVLLDLMLPDIDGYEVLKEIRSVSNVPVIILTVKADEADKVRGLELGADDYITKPFGHRELVSRIKAVLRRTEVGAPSGNGQIRVDDNLTVDFDKREVLVRGERVKLRPTEYRLLNHLMNNSGKLLTHYALLSRVWGREYRDDTQLLRLYITYLRQKIEPDPSHPKYIINERGLGYRFMEFTHPDRTRHG
ncbi:MAG: response regulator transcription factor [Dehalococcoidia bacterium]|nr:response regulator transcription factor [Dehalococcoidia bacterium]